MNLTGVRDPINRYAAPEGWNRLNSPNIANLRAVFTSVGAPVTGFVYPAFLATVRHTAARLSPDEQQAVATSNDWERTINASVTGDAQRQEIRTAIATSTPAPPAPPPPAPVPVPAPPRAGPVRNGGSSTGSRSTLRPDPYWPTRGRSRSPSRPRARWRTPA